MLPYYIPFARTTSKMVDLFCGKNLWFLKSPKETDGQTSDPILAYILILIGLLISESKRLNDSV